MGKSSRVKSARQELLEIKKQEEARLAAEKKSKMITTLIITGVCVVVAAAFITILAVGAARKANGTVLRNQIALSTENFEVNGATFNYFVNYEYQNFINKYASNLESYGLDVSVDLRAQETSDGQNWFEYMTSRTRVSLEEILRLCEKAKSEGYILDDEDEKEIKAYFEELDKEAKESNISSEEYITLLYGQGVNAKDIEAGLRLSTLATKYYDDTIGNREYTQKEQDEYFEKNKATYQSVDYKYYGFTIPTTSLGGAVNESDAAYKEVYAKAEKLAKAKTPKEFDSILASILKSEGLEEDDIKDELGYTDVEGVKYDKDFEIAVWSFGKDAKLYGTKIYKAKSKIEVYMITKLPYLDETETQSVRHILVSAKTQETDEKAKKKAEEILAEFNKGDKTAESFGALATKYTEDTASAETGGLYENFGQGEMVQEFEDWAFDKARKVGDTGIVKSEYGYHIMYYVSGGEPMWKALVRNGLKDSVYTELYNDLKETYKTTFNEEVLDSVNTIVMRTSNAQ